MKKKALLTLLIANPAIHAQLLDPVFYFGNMMLLIEKASQDKKTTKKEVLSEEDQQKNKVLLDELKDVLNKIDQTCSVNYADLMFEIIKKSYGHNNDLLEKKIKSLKKKLEHTEKKISKATEKFLQKIKKIEYDKNLALHEEAMKLIGARWLKDCTSPFISQIMRPKNNEWHLNKKEMRFRKTQIEISNATFIIRHKAKDLAARAALKRDRTIEKNTSKIRRCFTKTIFLAALQYTVNQKCTVKSPNKQDKKHAQLSKNSTKS